MSPDAQRIAIAEACPDIFWVSGDKKVYPAWFNPDVTPRDSIDGEDCPDAIDPLNDLNTMHEAEETLNSDQCTVFAKNLGEIHPTYCVIENERGTDEEFYQTFGLIHATAAQRAEAFLRTIGKWEDSA